MTEAKFLKVIIVIIEGCTNAMCGAAVKGNSLLAALHPCSRFNFVYVTGIQPNTMCRGLNKQRGSNRVMFGEGKRAANNPFRETEE